MKKRLLSALLVLTMVLGMIPVSVSAADVLPFTVTVDGQNSSACQTHTDADTDGSCDKCTMSLAPAGSFALLAVNADGYVIEPCYVPYAKDATLKEALKASGHVFQGIDSGFISAIDGVVDNYSLYCDGGSFDL